MKITNLFLLWIFPLLGISQNVLSTDSFSLVIKQAIDYQDNDAYGKAANLLADGIANVGENNIPDSLLAFAYHKLGVSQYYLSFNDDAISSWSKALEIRTNFLDKTNKDIIKGYRNIGNAYVDKGQFEVAQQSMEKALKLNLMRGHPDSNLLTEIYRELGYILTEQNDFANAEIYLNAAVELSPLVFKDEPWEIAHTYNLLLLLNLQLNRPRAMIECALKGLDIYESLDEKYEEDFTEMAHFYNNLGIAHEKLKAYEKAINYYQKSIDFYKKYSKDSDIEQARCYNNLAGLYNEYGDFPQALLYIEKAINLDKSTQNINGLAANYNTKGTIFLKRADSEQALTYFQKSIELLVSNFKSKTIHELPPIQTSIIGNKPYLLQSLFEKAKTYHKLYQETNTSSNLIYGIQTIDSINILINQVRTGFESDASKEFLTNQAKSIFETAIEICFQLAQLTGEKEKYFQKATAYAEQSKSIILLEAVRESGAKKMAGIPENLLKREQQLKSKIASVEEDIFTTNQSKDKNDLSSQLLSTQQQLESLIDTFEQFYPTYHDLKYNFESFNFQAYQQQLSSNECILEYFVGEKHNYWFYLDKNGINMDTISSNLSLNDWVVEFRNSITDPFVQNSSTKDSSDEVYARLGHQFYHHLVAPALSQKEVKKVRIIPDGFLGYLPFDALLTNAIESGQIGQYNIYPFLQKETQISYSYSISLLNEMQQYNPQPKKKELLAFATTFNATQALELGSTEIKLSPLLANVPTTENLLAKFIGKGYLETKATKFAFLQEAPNYAFLHLASHAQINDENADYSFISFSQNEEQIQQEELLFVNELYNIPLQAEMVVLSACETALGTVKKGEGIISLARAFAYAGAQSIITTLWQVSDQRSSELITAFYNNLSTGQPKDVALWNAKNEQIENGFNAHPYNWAGYIPIGNMQAIQLSPKSNFPIGKIGLLLLLLGAGWWMFSKKSKS